MSKPGFFNDNEYRAYPFISVEDLREVFELIYVLPEEAIVDAGFVFGPAANFDSAQHKVYLRQISAADGILLLKFSSTLFGSVVDYLVDPSLAAFDLVFQRNYTRDENDIVVATEGEWATEHAASISDNADCADEPLWSGFIVTGKIEKLIFDAENAGGVINILGQGDVGGMTSFVTAYIIEPARIQNLRKAYLRSVSVGNYERTVIAACENTAAEVSPCADKPAPQIILNATCLKGPIAFKEGYNTRITQTDRTNTLTFTAARGSGQREDEELCNNHAEIPFYTEEVNNKPFLYAATEERPAVRSKFLSGGWSCKDLIFTINGVGGSNVNIVGGRNVQVGFDETQNAITVKLSESAQGKCNA